MGFYHTLPSRQEGEVTAVQAGENKTFLLGAFPRTNKWISEGQNTGLLSFICLALLLGLLPWNNWRDRWRSSASSREDSRCSQLRRKAAGRGILPAFSPSRAAGLFGSSCKWGIGIITTEQWKINLGKWYELRQIHWVLLAKVCQRSPVFTSWKWIAYNYAEEYL